MSLPWDQETATALRAAQAVLAPADLAWFEAAHASAFLDPAAAMERIFGELLGDDAAPAADADLEPESIATMRRREPHVTERAPAEPAARPAFPSAPARRVARDPHPRSPSIRPYRPFARDDAPVHARSLDAPASAGAVHREPSKPSATPDASPEPIARAGAPIAEQRATDRELVSRADDRPGSNGIRRALAAADPPAQRGMARTVDQPLAPGARAAEPERSSPHQAAAPGTRLVSGLSELNNLFRSVIESQSDDRPAPQPAPSRAQHETGAAQPPAEFGDTAEPNEIIRPDTVRRSGPPIDHAHEAGFRAPSAAPGRQVAFRAETPPAAGHAPLDTFASFAGTASTLPDAAREDVLLDRLLDRFEERLREQAIRHHGFTGGLT
jgi:hypothetical protein